MERKRTFKYSTKSIAEATGQSQYTVRRHIREGKFRIENFASVCRYVSWRMR
jgi:hypothetical protein